MLSSIGAAVVYSFIDLWTGPTSLELDLWVVKVLKEGEAQLKSNGDRDRWRGRENRLRDTEEKDLIGFQ